MEFLGYAKKIKTKNFKYLTCYLLKHLIQSNLQVKIINLQLFYILKVRD